MTKSGSVSQDIGHGGSVLARVWKAFSGNSQPAAPQETQPVSIEDMVEDEACQLLEAAGVPESDYDLRLVAPGQFTGRGSDDEWLVFVRLRRWREGTDWVMVGLERKLQRRLASVDIPVRAVYWRVLPEARSDWAAKAHAPRGAATAVAAT